MSLTPERAERTIFHEPPTQIDGHPVISYVAEAPRSGYVLCQIGEGGKFVTWHAWYDPTEDKFVTFTGHYFEPGTHGGSRDTAFQAATADLFDRCNPT